MRTDEMLKVQGIHDELMAEIERLRAIIADACEVLIHYDLPEHAFHYQRVLEGKKSLHIQKGGK